MLEDKTNGSKKVKDISKEEEEMYVNYRTTEVDYVNVFLDMYVFVFVCVVALRKLGR